MNVKIDLKSGEFIELKDTLDLQGNPALKIYLGGRGMGGGQWISNIKVNPEELDKISRMCRLKSSQSKRWKDRMTK